MIRDLRPNELDLLKRNLEKKELQQFFFRKVKGLHWFNALEEKGFFSSSQNPRPIESGEKGYFSIPPWMPIEYLVSTSPELSEPENEEYARKTLAVLRMATSFAKENAFSNYRTWYQFGKILKYIPLKLFLTSDIELFSYWFLDPFESGLVAEEVGNNLIPRLLDSSVAEHHEMAISLIETLFGVTVKETKYDTWTNKRLVFRFNAWHFENSLKKVPVLSANKLGLNAVKLFEKKLDESIDLLGKNEWSSIWRRAIEDHEQNSVAEDAEHKLLEAFRDSLDSFVTINPSLAQDYILGLLNSDSALKKRIAIYTVKNHFPILKGLVNVIINSDYLSLELRHEVWQLLNKRFSAFSKTEREGVLENIFSIEGDNEDPALKTKRTAYLQACWLSSVKEHDSSAEHAYKKCIEVIGEEPTHPDFTSYFTSFSWQGRTSPIPIETLVAMDADSLFDTLSRFKEPSDDRTGGIGDLADSLKSVIKSKPDEMTQYFQRFLNLDIAYMHSVLQAYRELWKDSQDANWSVIWPKLFDAIIALIEDDHFWDEEINNPRGHFTPNRNWIVKEVGELIEAGTKSDKNAFDPSLNDIAKKILVYLLDKQFGAEDSGSKDPVTSAINSPKGKLIEGLINLTLRACRLSDKAKAEHVSVWKEFEPFFDRLLANVGDDGYEFQTLFAMYLPNFLFMSKDWTLANIKNLFDRDDQKKWICALNGYAFVNMVHETIYLKLKELGILTAALDELQVDDRIRDKIVQNICVSYWTGFENLESGSQMAILLERKIAKEIEQVIWFMWTLKGHNDPKLREKVFALWPKIIDLSDFKTKEGRSIASRLSKWAAYVEEFTPQTLEWLSAVAPFANENHNAHFMLENLARLSEKQPMEAQSVWLKMLDTFSYDFPEESIQKILRCLVLKGPEGKRKAREVADKYIKLGLDNPTNWLNRILESL